LHRGKRSDSFRASLSKSVFHCFACQASGNVLDFVAAIENCSIREAALRLQNWFVIPDQIPPPIGWPHNRTLQLVREKENNPPLHFALTGLNYSHPYLRQRGIDPNTAREFGVGYYGGPGLMSGRIVVPIHNVRGELVAYAGRGLHGGLPKYKLPTGFHKALELFNFHRAAATSSKVVIVVEGYFDCMRVHQAGLPCVVALMGASLSMEQETSLLRRFAQFVLMLDGDATGCAASRVIADRISERCLVTVVSVPSGTQPDQLPPAAIRQLVGGAHYE
jgi:DNA primase